jgi:ABC-type transport system involved in multi-copper enzyme maturation permease subunit
MIWLTWQQMRVATLSVFGALGLAAVVLVVTGPQLADLVRDSGESFFDRLGADGIKTAVFTAGTAIVYAVPALVGVFWGAPLVARELETGTHRLVWNQSITRTRWLATKLGLAALAAGAAGAIGLALTWWTAPIDGAIASGVNSNSFAAVPRLWPDLFGARGVVPIAMAVLALAIGVTAGLVIRRAVPAMAMTLGVVVAIQVAAPMLLQQHLLQADRITTTITADKLRGLMLSANGPAVVEELQLSVDSPGAWVTENVTLDPSGAVAETLPDWVEKCGGPPGRQTEEGAACFARLADEGYQQRIDYFPASRFWPMQWIESGILLGVAATLTGFCFWRIRRDLT